MRAHTLLCRAATAAILLPACAQRPPAPAWPPLEHAEFIVTHNDSVIATERTARSLDLLEGEITMPSRARVRYAATLTGPGTVSRLEARLASPTTPLEDAITIELGDTLTVSSSRWGGMAQPFPAVAAVYIHPSPALLEILLRRALIAEDPSAPLRVWLVGQNAAATARMHVSDGETFIEMAGTRVRIVHDNGYILMGDVPSLGWVFRRR